MSVTISFGCAYLQRASVCWHAGHQLREIEESLIGGKLNDFEQAYERLRHASEKVADAEAYLSAIFDLTFHMISGMVISGMVISGMVISGMVISGMWDAQR